KHVLAHGKGGLKVERKLRDDAQSAEVDDSAGEGLAVLLPGEGDEVAGGVDEFESRDHRCEVALRRPRSMRSGGAGTDDGDVRQGSRIPERVTLLVQIGAEIAVA